jgi:hypothetical protein
MFDRQLLGVATVGLATVVPIALMWIGFDHVVTWKILGTCAVLLTAAWALFVLNSSPSARGERPTPLPDNASQVTYVLDRDLVRFVKLAGSVLSLFLILGAYLVGIDLKNSVEVVQKIKEDTQTALRDAQQAGYESRQAELAIRGTKSDIAESAEEIRQAKKSAKESEGATQKSEQIIQAHLDVAQRLVNEIRGTRSQAQTVLESMGQPPPQSAPLAPEQVARLVELKLLKGFRDTLPPEQFAQLEAQFRSDAVLRPGRKITSAFCAAW